MITYHQLPLHADSCDLSAFITQEGLFLFRPLHFKTMMEAILKGPPDIHNILGYAFIAASSQEEDYCEQFCSTKDASLSLNI